jgi:ABC-type transport system substrate-binding protein
MISSLVLSFALGLLVAAAAGRPFAKDGGILVIAARSFDFIDPALVLDPPSTDAPSLVAATWGVADASCAMLLRYPVSSPPVVRYDLVPEVATALPALSRDGKTYMFTIRKGFRFSTGAPVTAANYAAAIKRVLDPAMNSPGAQYLQDVASVNADGAQLVIRLKRKVPDFPARTTMPYFCPVPTNLDIDPEGVPAPLPGSGPYYVAEFVRGNRVVLKRNLFYRGNRPHHLDQIAFQVGDDPVVATQKVETGELDVDLNVPLPTLEELGRRYGVNKTQFFSVRSPALFEVYMNTERPLFRKNPKLRQAVNFALDRTAMLQAFGPHFGTRTDSYLPSGLPGYLNSHPYPVRHPDLTKARALARGHTRSGKAVYYACDSVVRKCLAQAQLVQYALKQVGIAVEIKQFPVAAVIEKTGTRGEPFDLTDRRVDVAWVDPYQYIDLLIDGRTIQATMNTNRSYFNSSHYNALIDRARSLSGRARYAAYGKLAVDVARNSAPMAAFAYRNARFFVSSRVGCVSVGAHQLDLAGLCLR